MEKPLDEILQEVSQQHNATEKLLDKARTAVNTPSIGRIVHYVARGSADGAYKPVCRAAIITEVNEITPRFVDLCVLNPSGLFFNDEVSFDESNVPGTWHWPERV